LHPPRARTAVVLLFALLGVFAAPAAAATWTVKPADNKFGAGRQGYRFTINPGAQVDDGIVVANPGTTPLHLALYAADAFTTRAGTLGLVTKDATSTRVGAWVHPDRDDVTVGAGEAVQVPFAIALPKDAGPGDYVGGIVTQAAGADRRVGIQIRLRVAGTITPSLSVERVHVHYANTLSPVGKGDATVTYTIHNTGNAILNARQTVSVSGPFGSWDVAAGKLADSPALLPGDTWKVSAPLHDVTPALRLTATVTLVPLLTDAAGSTAPLAATTASGQGWSVPWSLLLLAVIVICGLVVAARALRPRRASAV
jgi:hypothetical protein